MSSAASRRLALRCPACRAKVERVRRLPEDHASGHRRGLRRYRCTAEACAWSGLLSRVRPHGAAWHRPELQRAVTAAVAATWRPGRQLLVAGVVAGAVALPLLTVVLIGLGVTAGSPSAISVAQGESHDGAPLPIRSAQLLQVADVRPAPAAEEAALTVRHGCAWGRPGRNPYRGTMAQALHAAQLPPEVVRQFVALQQAGQKSGRLEIRRGAIRTVDGGREFNAESFAMTFGHTLCLDSRVNFAPGHVEAADLYEVRDDQGRRHAVMVPDVCGNVSVLSQRGTRSAVAGLAHTLARRSQALAAQAEALSALDAPAAGPGAGGVAGSGVAAIPGGTAGDGGAGPGGGAVPGATAAGMGRAAGASGSAESAGAGSVDSGLRPVAAAGQTDIPPRSQALGKVGAPEGGDPVPATAPAPAAVAQGGDRGTGGAGGNGGNGGDGRDSGDGGGVPDGTDPGGPVATPPGVVLAGIGKLTDLLVPRGPAITGLKGLSEALAGRSEQLTRLAAALGSRDDAPAGGKPVSGSRVAEVPEPGTLASVLLALAVMLAALRRRR